MSSVHPAPEQAYCNKTDMKVSITIPTYNRAHLIEPAIKSIFNQTVTDWELIVVDDGSSDNTAEVVEKYLADPRVRNVRRRTLAQAIAVMWGWRTLLLI